MTIMSTRTAPAGARFSRPSADRLATIDTMIARAAAFGDAFGGGGRMTATDIAPNSTSPAPAAPNTAPDTGARLDAHDAQLRDLEGRVSALEERSSPPAVDTGAQAAPPAASAAAPVSAMLSGTAIYARMNARPTSLKAAAATTAAPTPAMIQTSAGPILNARAIHDRNNAAAAARVGQGGRC